MAQTYLNSGLQIGNREDLIDFITNVAPTETKFMSLAGKKTCDAQKHEWLTESLAASNAANAAVEGASASFAASDFTVRTRVFNYCQIPRRSISVSYSQDAINKPELGKGPQSEFSHQRMLKTKELAKDMNAALVSANTRTQPAPESSTAGQMDGAQTIISSNVKDLSGTTIISQDVYNQLVQSIWAASGQQPDTTFAHGYNKRMISAWTTPTVRNIDAAGKKLVETINVYESDFGIQTIVLERELTTSVVLVMTMKYWNTAFLRPVFFEEIGKLGGKSAGYVEAELTLEGLAEKSSGKLINCLVGS